MVFPHIYKVDYHGNCFVFQPGGREAFSGPVEMEGFDYHGLSRTSKIIMWNKMTERLCHHTIQLYSLNVQAMCVLIAGILIAILIWDISPKIPLLCLVAQIISQTVKNAAWSGKGYSR